MGFERELVLGYGGEFGAGAGCPALNHAIDLLLEVEVVCLGAAGDDGPGEVIAGDFGEAGSCDGFEFAFSDEDIFGVERGGVNFDEDFMRLEFWWWCVFPA